MEEHDGVVEWCESNGVTCENPFDEFAWLWDDWDEDHDLSDWSM